MYQDLLIISTIAVIGLIRSYLIGEVEEIHCLLGAVIIARDAKVFERCHSTREYCFDMLTRIIRNAGPAYSSSNLSAAQGYMEIYLWW